MTGTEFATFRDAIEAHAARAPDGVFVCAPEPDAALTWADLRTAATRFAAAMGADA